VAKGVHGVTPTAGEKTGSTVVKVRGAIDTVGAAQLEQLLASDRVYTTRLVIDMSEATFLGTAGQAALEHAAVRRDTQDRPLAIVIGNRHAEVLHTIDQTPPLHNTVRLFDTLNHALTDTATGRRS
jgi:anti-anti-sigma regulatory factor